MADLMEKIVSLCKRRGFIYPSSEIYGGFGGFYDYGPLGVELKNNIKREWWKFMVYEREDVVGMDAAIIMSPKVWEASGHLKSFTDPLVECKTCHKRFRKDKFEEFLKLNSFTIMNTDLISEMYSCVDGKPHRTNQLTDEKKFNLMTEVLLGVTEPKQLAYLRGEITQGVHVNFFNVLSSTRLKIPFGIAQIGKAFRNEITPGNFTYRMREFEQMELQFYIKPNDGEGQKWFGYWKETRLIWYTDLGLQQKNLRFRDHETNERAHYARIATDIEYHAPFGWNEFEGIHHRSDWDLSQHTKNSGRDLNYFDDSTKERYIPWVIETSGGVDRATLFFLLDAYSEDNGRVILKLHPKLAPIKVAVFPLVANKSDLVKKARSVYKMLKQSELVVAWDDRGNIGKRYLYQDEIGTPWCVTIDYNSLKDNAVTVRDRNTTKQIRLPYSQLAKHFRKRLS